eukprot:TRINITY_DN56415_c0_g1_i1.p1 TRINITY_DN56415_c0_g1~~TRINITY_DN56415_c0_g1_i1.p1  ORF type:complete len:338 (-),score=42.35 TRINITY_DN56415_c0_g1_i1:44-1057(-)
MDGATGARFVEVTVVAISAFVAVAVGTVGNIGVACTFVSIMHLAAEVGLCSDDMLEIATYLWMSALTSGLTQSWHLRRHCNYSFTAMASVSWTAAESIGTRLLFAFEHDVWLTRSLGAMLLGVFLLEFLNGKRNNSCENVVSIGDSSFRMTDPRNRRNALIFGFSAGMLRGLLNVPFVALVLFALYSGIGKQEWRASSSMIGCLTLPFKAFYLFVDGRSSESGWSVERWPHYFASAVFTLLALPFSNWIANKLDPAQFRTVLLIILAFGATQLVVSGASRFWSGCACGIAFVTAVMVVFEHRKATQSKPNDRVMDIAAPMFSYIDEDESASGHAQIE